MRTPLRRTTIAAVQERVTWVGHATVLLELGGARALTDPVLRPRLAHLRRHAPAPAPHVTADLDAVLISHLHLDHLDMGSLRALERDSTLVVPPGAARVVRRLGFASVVELPAGAATQLAGMTVTAVRAIHDGRRRPRGPRADTLGFVAAGEQRVYFAGDTDVFDGMRDMAGELDVALLPVWGWGPTIGGGHMDPRTAARAAALLRPRVAVPIHWGTLYPIAAKRFRPRALAEPGRAFARHAAELAPDVEVRVLAPGETLELP